MCAFIVVAEDDAKQAELIRRYLESDQHRVSVVSDGRDAIDAVRRLRPQLLVLDVMLPTVDGLEVARILRAESDVPVLMLTARSTEDDLLLGLGVGADDYMTKPFSPRELVARARSLLRRAAAPEPPAPGPPGGTPSAAGPVLRVGGLAVDPVLHRITMDGVPVNCTPGEFRLLEALAAEPERVFSRQQLLERMHGFDKFITCRTIDMHVMNIRKKMEQKPARPQYLVTVFGVGYKLTDGSAAG